MNVWFCLYRALLLGMLLGVIYGFLRPLRPRWLGDLLFILALFYLWLHLVFGICGGDPRFAYTALLLGGCLLWEVICGKRLHPLFSCFWKGISRIFSIFLFPVKKILKKLDILRKFFFATGKKWVTIKCNEHSSSTKQPRRQSHGKKKPISTYQAGIPPQ